MFVTLTNNFDRLTVERFQVGLSHNDIAGLNPASIGVDLRVKPLMTGAPSCDDRN
jgi:hypothetical protein